MKQLSYQVAGCDGAQMPVGDKSKTENCEDGTRLRQQCELRKLQEIAPEHVSLTTLRVT